MPKGRIFTVGLGLPGPDFEYVDFDSNRTFLDADICIFEPTFGSVHYDYDGFQGHRLIDKSSSVSFKKNSAHWRNEIVTAATAGKLVVISVNAPIEAYHYTGRQETSGTGRSQRTTNIVNPCSTYDSVPNLTRVTGKVGASIKLTKDAGFLKPYWEEVSKYSPYQAEFEGKNLIPLLTAGSSDRTVGGMVKTLNGGAILFLPSLDLSSLVKKKNDEEFWTAEATKFGHRLSASLNALAETIGRRSNYTPPPSWTQSSDYRLKSENQLLETVKGIDEKVELLSQEKAERAAELAKAGSLRYLLYEQGAALEGAVLETMKLFGFTAENFAQGESEFDVVFVSREGRCLGEVEGKDSKAVNIDKFSQLERNIQEDFAREDVSDYAKAVLFGNAHRLKPLSERADFFTEKCLSAARRIGAALIRTPDLFEPAKYLQSTPNAEYAAACRQAIISTKGGIVLFPLVPIATQNN